MAFCSAFAISSLDLEASAPFPQVIDLNYERVTEAEKKVESEGHDRHVTSLEVVLDL